MVGDSLILFTFIVFVIWKTGELKRTIMMAGPVGYWPFCAFFRFCFCYPENRRVEEDNNNGWCW